MAFTDDFSGLTDGDNLDVSASWTASETTDLRRLITKQSSAGTDYIELDALGGSTDVAWYYCPDQGDADCYVQGRLYGFTAQASWLCALRIDGPNDDCVGWWLAGTGASGLRMVKSVGGSETNLETHQGVSDGWYKVEASGDQYSLWSGGSGSTPGTWSQLGSDQTVTNAEVATTTTNIGFRRISTPYNINFLQNFEAGALGGAATTSLWIPDPRWEEPNLLIPGKKPTGPVVVDWGHPLARGLVWYYAPFSSLNTLTINRVRDTQSPTVAGGSYTLSPSAGGMSGETSGTATAVYWTDTSFRSQITSKMTAWLDYVHISDAAASAFIFGNVSNSTNIYNWGLYAASGNLLFLYLKNASSSVAAVNGNLTLNDGERYRIVFTYDGAALKLWCNGVYLNSNTQTGNVSNTNYPVGFNSWVSTARKVRMGVLSAGISNEALPDGACVELSRNPYQFLIPA